LPHMDYQTAIEYLLSLADFERTGRFQERPDVAPMRSLLRRLGEPHLGRRTVHVAGSKGKGSVSAMVESILRASGQRTGLYTSPHLHDYTERVAIDGEPISRETFALLVAEMRPFIAAEQAAGNDKLVTFDLLTALAFLAFREAAVETQIIEVGLGGRLDQTNVFDSKDVAVITPLSYEHTAVLGDRIEQIAAEKAAIITRGCVAILAPQPYSDAANVVRDCAANAAARLVDVAADYHWSVGEHDIHGQIVQIEGPLSSGGQALSLTRGLGGTINVRLPLLGAHQAENAATAVAVAHALGIPGDAIIRGLESVRWPARIEVLSEDPLVIADGAHNSDSARRLRETLVDYFGSTHITFIIGVSGDKDLSGFVTELAPIAQHVIATRSRHPRAMDPSLVSEAFALARVSVENSETVSEAIERALAANIRGGLICLAGSLFVAAEGREYFHRVPVPLEE
jgi:dihydrofolate synthase/folylpolyglutamate synthase